jgi:hypothetical protein
MLAQPTESSPQQAQDVAVQAPAHLCIRMVRLWCSAAAVPILVVVVVVVLLLLLSWHMTAAANKKW